MKVLIVEGKEYEFDFDLALNSIEVYGKAIDTMVMQSLSQAGSIIVDACYQGDIVELKKNTKLYISLCLQAAGEIDILEAEVKKNS